MSTYGSYEYLIFDSCSKSPTEFSNSVSITFTSFSVIESLPVSVYHNKNLPFEDNLALSKTCEETCSGSFFDKLIIFEDDFETFLLLICTSCNNFFLAYFSTKSLSNFL